MTALIRSVCVVPSHKLIEVGLDLRQRSVEVLAERHLVDLLLNRLIETFHCSIGLRVPDSYPRMFKIVEMQK